ncbi:dihydrodiol dehydrogenase [Seminavis robusta]|uniref:Dihydrodiol dehydrogenase n=1 Tax=Seminavis robusta TaxID=568900 RepID=A0A9N8DDH9_9STRA|nr:dihydrodiol dehydrogenase [Seminavis robusta]|eukprot:Sro23_g016180.1 dihydrodiol dehydrogenase (468) ;mRNA; f:172483-174248
MICTLEPQKKRNSDVRSSNTHMSLNPLASSGESSGEQAGSLTRRMSYGDDVQVPWQTIADCGVCLDYYEKSRLVVGVILHTAQTSHRGLGALINPASNCRLAAVAIVAGPLPADMTAWMRHQNLENHKEPVTVFGGQEGAQQLVQREDVEAVFIIVPDSIHRPFVLSALEHKKHVLLNDPVSISLPAFNEQLQYAKKFGKFVQSSTPFIHQYRVRQFMDLVLREETFGRVTCMDAYLSVCPRDLPLVGIANNQMALLPNQGCIRRLGRYCVLFGILIFGKLGSHPIAAQVHDAEFDEQQQRQAEKTNGGQPRTAAEPVRAECTIKYSGDRKMTFTVDYSHASATRQKLEVKAGSSMANMSDFVFPHPDGLATYRLYEDIKKEPGAKHTEDMRGEAIDIAGGPSHDVVMWRNFAQLSRSIDEEGWEGGTSPLSERVRELAEITVHTKTILNALMKSLEEGCVEVPLVQ